MIVLTSDVSWLFYQGQVDFLTRRGFDVELVSSPGLKLLAMSAESAKTWQIPMEREISPLKDLVSFCRLYCLFRRRHPAVVIAATPKAGLLGTLAARSAGVHHVVYSVLGLRMETARGLLRGVLWVTEWLACHVAHQVRCVSASLQSRLVDFRFAPKKRCAVNGPGTINGVDVNHWRRNRDAVLLGAETRAKLGIPPNARVVGYAGRLTRDKGIPELCQAFGRLRHSHSELRLLLVGDFESGDPVPAEVRTFIEADPAIIRTGFVSDVAPYYWAMDVLALPTHREGFPGVLLEAQAASLPVVSTDATGAVDALIDGVTGIRVPTGDAPALTNALDLLLRDADLRTRMGTAGREWVEQSFRRELIWEAVGDDYCSILKSDRHGRETTFGEAFRRCIDFSLSISLLTLTTPVWLAAAIAIRSSLGAPILFRQLRPGLNGRPFTVLKFRTMRDARDNQGIPLSDAERITPLGRILRASSIDEIPQLWNVLRGEMSLVGPRPLLMQYLDRYTPEQARRHQVKPGITGWAQVNGRNGLSWEQKFALDLWYVDHRSFRLDIKILFLTCLQVLRRAGISQDGHATMPEFLGLPKLVGRAQADKQISIE